MQPIVKLLSSTALVAVAGVMAVPTASAQDIGALEKRVKALEKSGGGQNVARSKKTMKLVVSGHVNRIIQYRDNGVESGILHMTNINSRSRVRWVASGKINDDLTLGTYIELGNFSSASTNQEIGEGDDDGAVLDERHVDMWIKSKTLGKLYIGQGSSGTEGTSERDLSGTQLLSLNGDEILLARAEEFRNSATGAKTGISIRTVFDNFDGQSRNDRIRYDTPRFAGFQVTASHGNDDQWGAALRYDASIGGLKMTGAIGYSDNSTRNGKTQVNGSFSVLLPMGISFTVAGADDDQKLGGAQDDVDWIYGKIGYKFSALEIGQSRLFISYGEVDNRDRGDEGTAGTAGAGNEATAFSFGLVQIIEPLGLEFQLGYANFDVDLGSGVSTEDIDIVTVGLRAKF
jgi:predicted porin